MWCWWSFGRLWSVCGVILLLKKTQPARGWTAAEMSTLSLPAAWLALLLTKAGDVESNPGPTTHTNKHTPVIWICDLSQTNKQETHTHWVHLKCTQIKQGQYKPDWRCTIHTRTQNVTPSTAHQKQTTIHPLTNNNQPKDKNIVILLININGIRNKIEELKNLVHNTQLDIITIQETKLTPKAKIPKIPHHHTHRHRAQTRRGAHNTDQGRHSLHKHKHTQGHQHAQHRTTTDQNTHRQDQRHHSNKHILSTKRHDVTKLQHCGHRHRTLYTTRHQHTILTGDVNAHSTLWYSYTDDHRGQLISNKISNS